MLRVDGLAQSQANLVAGDLEPSSNAAQLDRAEEGGPRMRISRERIIIRTRTKIRERKSVRGKPERFAIRVCVSVSLGLARGKTIALQGAPPLSASDVSSLSRTPPRRPLGAAC